MSVDASSICRSKQPSQSSGVSSHGFEDHVRHGSHFSSPTTYTNYSTSRTMRLAIPLLRLKSSRPLIAFPRRLSSNAPLASSPQEHKVLLDNGTMYIKKELSEALGWKPEHGVDGLRLSLHGWEPSYFTITQSGTMGGWEMKTGVHVKIE